MRQSPVAVQQLLKRQQAKHVEQMEQLANIGDAAIEQLRKELNGLTLVNWLLVKRLGGEVTVPDEDMEQSIGRLQMARSEEAKEWKLIALAPEPVDAEAERCSIAEGKTEGNFFCTREAGHEGPCAARETNAAENARVEGAEG